IQKIAESRAPVLLARPDGFGKTTIVSTLEELFKHGIKPYDDHDSFFKGLDIEKTWNDTGTYHVLRLDFSDDFSPSYDPNTLETVLINKIKKSALVLL
ncbi:MAG: AAA family ATPase, partial [Succinatimonas sp.]|nr:AAA family ATPase [Succinatimonas sp.]